MEKATPPRRGAPAADFNTLIPKIATFPSGSDIPLPELHRLIEVIRLHIRVYLRDPRYTIFWNEDTGIETLVTALP